MPPKKAVTSTKRFLKPTIRWADFNNLVNPEEKGNFLAFKGKSESYLQRVQSNPEEAPKIDWEAYKKMIPNKSIVEKLQSAYQSFKVPYPQDTLTSKVNAQWKDLRPKIDSYCKEQSKIIDAANEELDILNALPPFDQITMEMFADLYPNLAIHPVEKPTFWPHTEDEQEGYKSPEQKAHHKE